MLEYASRRLRFFCASADRVADDHRRDREPPDGRDASCANAAGNASSQTRRNAANAAAFTAAAMYAVIGVGAPS